MVVVVPLQLQGAAWQMGCDVPIGAPDQGPGHADGRGPGAAGQRDAAAAFPGAHRDFIRPVDLNKMDVDSFGEFGGPLQPRPDARQRHVGDVATKQDQVRISHRDAGHPRLESGLIVPGFVMPAGQIFLQRKIDHAFVRGHAGKRHRDFAGGENRPAHVDPHASHLAGRSLFEFDVERQHAVAGFDPQRFLAGQAMIKNIFGHAADSVAAHFRFRSVGVEHPHPRIGNFRGADQNQSVAADTEMPIGNLARQSGRVVGHFLLEAIDIHIVVAQALHLGEPHRSTSLCKSPLRQGRRGQGTKPPTARHQGGDPSGQF